MSNSPEQFVPMYLSWQEQVYVPSPSVHVPFMQGSGKHSLVSEIIMFDIFFTCM